jgi:hypothetical protein
MSGDPIEIVLQRLEPYGLRASGRDRWRSRCPGHDGDNVTALSIGVSDTGAVLLRCWRGCDAEQVAHALGLDLHDLFPPRLDTGQHGAGPVRRRRLLTAQQALDLLAAESQIVFVVASDIHRERAVSEADFERLGISVARIGELAEEVHS